MSHFPHPDRFQNRHIGPNPHDLQAMLQFLNVNSLDELIHQTVPDTIRLKKPLNLPPALSEFEYLAELKTTAQLNRVMRSYIGMGYYGTITPSVVLRNVFQNPGWYTQYTPYQAEIAQGRLESLLNFQTMVSDLTGLPIANASLLDEGTAASEAMHMFYAEKNKRAAAGEEANEFFVADTVFPQTIDVLKTRALPQHIKLVTGDWRTYNFSEKTFGVLLQYPNMAGEVEDYRAFVEKAKAHNVFVCVAADMLSLALLTPPGEWGADCAVGNTQRFGVPWATVDRMLHFSPPGRFQTPDSGSHHRRVGGQTRQPRLRMALQTREQHIRREKATSNICTAQALVGQHGRHVRRVPWPGMASAVSRRVRNEMAKALVVRWKLRTQGFKQTNFFDTLRVNCLPRTRRNAKKAENSGYQLFLRQNRPCRSALDETVTEQDLNGNRRTVRR
jgi:glycine dehydrogenase